MAGAGRCCAHDRARHGLAQLLVPLDVVLPQRVLEAAGDGVLAEVEQQLQELVAAAVAAADRVQASAGQTSEAGISTPRERHSLHGEVVVDLEPLRRDSLPKIPSRIAKFHLQIVENRLQIQPKNLTCGSVRPSYLSTIPLSCLVRTSQS